MSTLPIGRPYESQPTGIDVTRRPSPITPSVTWRIRVDEIREKQSWVWKSHATETSRSWMDVAVSRHCRKYMHVVSDVLAACARDLHSGVGKIPAEIREPFLQRLLDQMCIEPARDAYVENKFITPREREKSRPRDKVFMTDVAGNAWFWNCGWYRVGEDGSRLDAKPVLSHAVFRRRIKLATLEELGRTSFKYTRPWGQWRKGSGQYVHMFFGSVTLHMTDGVHAIVILSDGTKEEVEFENLQVLGVAMPRRASMKSKESSPRKAREKKPLLNEQDLADLADLLGDDLDLTDPNVLYPPLEK